MTSNAGSNSAFPKLRHALLSSRRTGWRAASARLQGFHIIARTLNKRMENFPREECFLTRLPKRSPGGHSLHSRIAKETPSCSAHRRADRVRGKAEILKTETWSLHEATQETEIRGKLKF